MGPGIMVKMLRTMFPHNYVLTSERHVKNAFTAMVRAQNNREAETETTDQTKSVLNSADKDDRHYSNDSPADGEEGTRGEETVIETVEGVVEASVAASTGVGRSNLHGSQGDGHIIPPSVSNEAMSAMRNGDGDETVNRNTGSEWSKKNWAMQKVYADGLLEIMGRYLSMKSVWCVCGL